MYSSSNIQSMLKKAQQIRHHIKTANKSAQNILNYQKFKIQQSKPNHKSKPCCGHNRSEDVIVQQQFKATFDKLRYQDKVRSYYKTCENVLQCLEGQQYQSLENQQSQIKKFILHREGLLFTQWNRKSITINRKTKQILFQKNSDIIDLHQFIVRKSKNQKQSLVLEPIRNFGKNKATRITSSQERQFPQFFQLIQTLCDEAQFQTIRETLKGEVNKKSQSNKNKRPSIQHTIKKVRNEIDNPQNQVDAIQAIKLSKIKEEQHDVYTQSNDANRRVANQIITSHFIYNLQNFNDYRKVRDGVYYSKKGLKVRKIYQFQNSQIKIEKLIGLLFDQSKFYRWKPTLKSIMDPNINAKQKNKKIIYQLHHFPQSKIQQGYIYDRQHFVKGSIEYILDTNHKQYVEQADSVLKGQLNYVVWQIRNKNEHHVELVVEAEIDHFVKQELNQKLTDQFLGQIKLSIKPLPKNSSSALLSVPIKVQRYNFQTEDFGNQNLSQISNNNDRSEYFSVQSKQDSASILNNYKQNQTLFKSLNTRALERQNTQEIQYKINQRQPPTLLSYCHVINPLPGQKVKKTLKIVPNQHFHLGKDWIVKEDGNLKNINEQMIKAQRNVLTAIIKNIGRNILNGKGIMHTSLPVNVFARESFLEIYCKSFSHAPLYLQPAAKTDDIVQKFKAGFKLMLGMALLNVVMEKPFNPILGQTYQGLVDGCPIYGQQISHHPPISAVFMKGRGYFIHGTREPQIDIGIRSAIGVMHGLWYIAFHNSDPQKNKITIMGTSGQVKGLIFGQRLVRTIHNTVMFDEANLLYCCVNWGPGILKGSLSNNYNTFSGKLLKIKSTSTFNFKQEKKRPGKSDIQTQLGTFHGQWSDKCYFNDELIFDFNNSSSCLIDQYNYALQSDVQYRKDRNLRRAQNWEQAQDAKQQLEQLQRHDRKLRKDRESQRRKG